MKHKRFDDGPIEGTKEIMKNHFKKVLGVLAATAVVAMVVGSGCMPSQQAQTQPPPNPNLGRWQIFGTPTGAFMVDTQTGESYVFIPAALSWALCNRVTVQFQNPPPAAAGTPATGTPAPTPAPPVPTPPGGGGR